MLYFVLGIVGLIAFGTPFIIRGLVERDSRREKREDPEIVKSNVKKEVIRGKNLRVIRLEPKQETDLTVFFIHGLGGEMAQWADQLPVISKSANVVAMDLVGHGKSDGSKKLSDYSTDSIIEDLLVIFSKYKSTKNILIGHSYGSALATKLSLKSSVSQSLSGLVLIGPRASLHQSQLLRWIPYWVFDIFRLLDRRGGENSVSVRRMVHPSAPQALKLRQLSLARSNKTNNIMPIFRGMKWPEEEDWKKLNVPLLIIFGEADQITPPSGAEKLVELTSKNSPKVHIIKNAGHNVMLEDPTKINRLILEFIEKCTK